METAKVGNLSSKRVSRRWMLKRSPVCHLAQHKRIYDMTSASTLRRVEMFALRYETSDNLWDSKNSTQRFSPLHESKGLKLIRSMGSSGIIKIFAILLWISGEVRAINGLINYKLVKSSLAHKILLKLCNQWRYFSVERSRWNETKFLWEHE